MCTRYIYMPRLASLICHIWGEFWVIKRKLSPVRMICWSCNVLIDKVHPHVLFLNWLWFNSQVNVRITGKVQGCYFRKWSREQAKQMTINGWIRNCKDGSVEAVFSGRPAAVDSMLEKCKVGPGRARVVDIEVQACEQPRGVGFKQLADYKYVKTISWKYGCYFHLQH